jgi:hypothetical protein
MNYLVAGLAKSGTTILFSRMQQAITPDQITSLEPDRDEQLQEILSSSDGAHTLTKVLIGRVTSRNDVLKQFQRHVVIHRDPRDQFISMLLYLFYDFQLSGDSKGFDQAHEALAYKVKNPEACSTIELYNLIAKLVGRAPIGVFDNLHREQRNYIETFSPSLLRYEDFLDNKVQAIEEYLGLELNNQAEVPEEYQRVARSRGYGNWRCWLNDSDLAYINEQWGDTIESLNYTLESSAGALSIPEVTSLGYVSQFEPIGSSVSATET